MKTMTRQQKWNEKNKEKTKIATMRYYSKKFIEEHATEEELILLQEQIKKKLA